MQHSKQKKYSNAGNTKVIELVPESARLVLDIGCGDGSTARLLVKRNCIIDGVTISENERTVAKQVMRNVFIYNIEKGLPVKTPAFYDAVICSHVLEHVCYPQQIMEDIHTVLKPGGTLIVALPNIMHYRSRWLLVKGNFNYKEAGIWDYTHFKWYTFKTGIRLFKEDYFKVILATVTGELPLNSVFKKILPAAFREFIFSMLIKISPGFFGYQLLYSAVKIDPPKEPA